MVEGGSEREELLADLLVQYEQQLASGTVAESLDTSSIAGDAELLAEWEADRSCLQLLDRVRRHRAPNDARSYTPVPQPALISTRGDQFNTTLGRFRIVRELGRGGLGIVYLAYDPKLARQVALKVPRPESLLSNDLRKRFLREAEAAARLNHPNLVSVYEADEEENVCFIVAEFCPGPTLSGWLKARQAPVPLLLAARMVQQLAEAVQHAHAHGVLHRDIKPSNVLLTKPIVRETDCPADPESLSPKLTDFGMAKLLEREGDETRSGVLVGTPAYMAPEQAQGRVHELDSRTDVYGLGAILYECLTGQRVFETQSDIEALRRVLFEEAPSPRRLRPSIPRDLEAICLKCLDKQPTARYQTAQHLAEDLGRFLAGEPTQARPSNAAGQLWKWARRRPAIASLVSVVLLATITLLGVVIAYNSRLNAEVSRTALEVLANRRLLYTANVRLAYETYMANDVVQTHNLLNSQIPETGQEDLREFAWYYLQEQCNPATLKLEGHTGDVFSVAYSIDGTRMATAGKDRTVRLWDATTGAQTQVLRGHTSEVTSVAFSPDGRTLASGSEDTTIRLWDIATGSGIAVLTGHTDHVLAVAYSPDGQQIVSGGRDQTVRLWDVASRELSFSMDDRIGIVRAADFSPSGDKLFAVDEAGQLHIWRTVDWHRLLCQKLHQEKLFSLAVSGDGKLLAAAGRMRAIWSWVIDGENIQELPPRETEHTDWILSLAYSSLDNTLASAGRDAIVQLWKPENTDPFKVLRGHKRRVGAVAWSPDGQHLASASEDETARIWSLAAVNNRPYAASSPSETSPTFSRDSNKLFTSGPKRNVHVWDPMSGALTGQFEAGNNRTDCIEFSPDGLLIATRTFDGEVSVRSSKSFAEVLFKSPTEDLRPDDVCLAWLPTGHAIAINLAAKTVAIVDVDSQTVTHKFELSATVRDVCCTRSGHLAIATTESLDIWDLRTNRRVHSLPEPFSIVAASESGTLLAASDRTNTVVLVDPHTGLAVARIVNAGVARHLAFSPDGLTLAIGTDRPATIILWDTRTKQELMKLECAFHIMEGLAFSPNGKRLVATGRDAVGSRENGHISEWAIGK